MSTLRNLTTNTVIASHVVNAKTFWQRTVGFIGREQISWDEGLWFDGCSVVHTMGMRTDIDVIFVDRNGYVLRIVRSAKPNNSQISCPLAHAVIETGACAHVGHDLLVGDQVALSTF